MSKDAAELFGGGAKLPAAARAAIADSLLDSLEDPVDESADEAWRVEIERRVAELNSGTVETTDWGDVRSRLRSRPRDS